MFVEVTAKLEQDIIKYFNNEAKDMCRTRSAHIQYILQMYCESRRLNGGKLVQCGLEDNIKGDKKLVKSKLPQEDVNLLDTEAEFLCRTRAGHVRYILKEYYLNKIAGVPTVCDSVNDISQNNSPSDELYDKTKTEYEVNDKIEANDEMYDDDSESEDNEIVVDREESNNEVESIEEAEKTEEIIEDIDVTDWCS